MKIKILNGLLIVDILTILLIAAITLIPSNVVRIILGLPFLLFFPGYTLVATIFISKGEINGIERTAFSFGLSIAVVALIGFGLNYTPWGISLEPTLYSVAIFTIVMSVIALIRQSLLLKHVKLTAEFNLRLPSWGGSKLSKSLSIILIVLILGATGALGYIIATYESGETFTEFYILGFNGKAQDYPTEFVMEKNQVTQVIYGTEAYNTEGEWGEVTLGIVSHERQRVTYSVEITIDDEPMNISYAGTIINQPISIELQQGETWEQEIGFSPRHVGDNQTVEFLLFKGDAATPESSLLLRISATSINEPPVLNAIGDKSVSEEELLEFIISATDPDGDPLTYSAPNLPSGAIFDTENQTFSWTPGSGQAGNYPDVRFEVSDGALTDSENITITVGGQVE